MLVPMLGLRLLLALPVVLLACTSVDNEPEQGGTGGAHSTSSTAIGSASATATSATVTGTATGTGGGQPGVGGSGGRGPIADCPDDETYFLDHTGPGATLFEGGCEGEIVPTATLFPGGEAGAATYIRACAPLGAPETSLVFDGSTPLYATGGGALTGTIGSNLSFVETAVAFDEYGDVGQPIRGTYAGKMMTTDGEVAEVSGVFTLCRAPDLPPAP
jgi:hypothetical protein